VERECGISIIINRWINVLDQLGISLYKRLDVFPEHTKSYHALTQRHEVQDVSDIPIMEYTSLITILDDVEASSRTLALEKMLSFGDGVELLKLGATDGRREYRKGERSARKQLQNGLMLKHTRNTL
jgi:hypothetical protein